jgi:hypothetical protein
MPNDAPFGRAGSRAFLAGGLDLGQAHLGKLPPQDAGRDPTDAADWAHVRCVCTWGPEGALVAQRQPSRTEDGCGLPVIGCRASYPVPTFWIDAGRPALAVSSGIHRVSILRSHYKRIQSQRQIPECRDRQQFGSFGEPQLSFSPPCKQDP